MRVNISKKKKRLISIILLMLCIICGVVFICNYLYIKSNTKELLKKAEKIANNQDIYCSDIEAKYDSKWDIKYTLSISYPNFEEMSARSQFEVVSKLYSMKVNNIIYRLRINSDVYSIDNNILSKCGEEYVIRDNKENKYRFKSDIIAEEKREKYKNTIPYEGMLEEDICYTSWGEADYIRKSRDFDHMVYSHRVTTYQWDVIDGDYVTSKFVTVMYNEYGQGVVSDVTELMPVKRKIK